MLLSFPEAIVDTYNDREMPYEVLEWYKEVIISFFDTLKRKVHRNLEGEIEPIVAHFDDDARKEWKRIFNEITHYQNDEDENEYLKSMYPKQKSYIPRFALLIHVFNAFFDSSNIKVDKISKESILKAERLSKYFIATAKKIKFNSVEVNQYKTILNENKKKSTREKIKEIYNNNTNFNRTEIAEMLGVSRQIVIKYANEAAEAGVNKV